MVATREEAVKPAKVDQVLVGIQAEKVADGMMEMVGLKGGILDGIFMVRTRKLPGAAQTVGGVENIKVTVWDADMGDQLGTLRDVRKAGKPRQEVVDHAIHCLCNRPTPAMPLGHV